MPAVEPRVAHQRGGELKVSDEAVFGYQRYLGQQCIPSLKGDQIVNPTNPNLDSTSPPPPNRHSPSKPNLAKFVGHLWRGAPAKSFVATVCSEPAHVVRVKMYQGGGRRGFNNQGWGRGGASGYGRGGPGHGGRGRGPKVWDRTVPQDGDGPKENTGENQPVTEDVNEKWDKAAAAAKAGDNAIQTEEKGPKAQ